MQKGKLNTTLFISITVVFVANFMFACSKKIIPGMILEETVTETASAGGFKNQMPRKSSESNTVPFSGSNTAPFTGSNEGGSGFEVAERERIADKRFQDTGAFLDTVALRDIYFKFDRYDLDDASRAVLTKNAAYLRSTNPVAKIEIQGHCDERGTNNYNISLGQRRAQSTKSFLVSQGVSGDRIHIISYGEERPFCFNSDKTCWSKNRRAHFRITG